MPQKLVISGSLESEVHAVGPPRPQKHEARLSAKRAHVAGQLAALKRNEQIVIRIGGIDRMGLNDEIAFQWARADVLDWCAAHTAAEIVSRRAAVHVTLGPDGVAAKGGSMQGLPMTTVALIAEAELLDLALGV